MPSHPDIPGTLGVVLPGTPVRIGTVLLAAASNGNQDPGRPMGGVTSDCMSNNDNIGTPSNTPTATGSIVLPSKNAIQALACCQDTPRPMILELYTESRSPAVRKIKAHPEMCLGPGFVLMQNACYNIRNWSSVRLEHIKLLSQRNTEPVTVRITTVALREPRVGDKFASRHGQAG